MKTNLIGVLISLIVAFNVISCSDDGKTMLHLKLSATSCEVMQLHTESIYMNATYLLSNILPETN